MNKIRVYINFQNADTQGRLRLNTVGTIEDLSHHGIVLKEGVELELYEDELEVQGTVQFSDDEKIWVAKIDWDSIKEHPI